MAQEEEPSSGAITTFKEYEAAGGKVPAPAPEKAAEPVEPVETVEKPEAEAEPETTEEAQPKPGTAQPPKKKLSLSDEHAKLLREVTELRKQRRELQAPATPAATPAATQAETAKPAATDDKAPARPKLSTFQGTLEEYEKAVDQYEEEQRKWLDRAFERKQAEQQAKAEQQKITESYSAKLAEHVKEHPEYDDEIGQTPMSELMANMVLHHGPALGQRLIDNKEEAKRITQLPRDIQIFEMGKLYAQSAQNGNGTQLEPEAEAPQPVKVPAKLSATGGSTSVMARPDHGAKNFAQFEELERRLAKRK